MSVGEELVECPLCMEPLELDDINFFPCTCGYQICRFCWHRIRTDENGLCPACRKQYPEDPAQFKPLTDDELQRIKKERRQKDVQRKQKAAENRKHLANVRVVQRNLVFVVGLSQRLSDADTLRKHDYFGKFGKIHKVVINQNTSYAGAQGPSASAYVTYVKPEDALRAIQAVNNCHVDGRTLKASLGTTKYCSHFLKGSQCPKPDCMYLHELGEEAASFTKEEMQQGKHQDYEQRLYEQFMNSQNLQNHTTSAPATTTTTTTTTTTSKPHKRKTGSPPIQGQGQSTSSGGSNSPGQGQSGSPGTSSKDGWPTLPGAGKTERAGNGGGKSQTANSQKPETQNAQNRAPGHQRHSNSSDNHHSSKGKDRGRTSSSASPPSGTSPPHNNGVGPIKSTPATQIPPVGTLPSQSKPAMPASSSPTHAMAAPSAATPPPLVPPTHHSLDMGTAVSSLPGRSPFDTSNSMSLFSSSGFPANRKKVQPQQVAENVNHNPEIPDTMPVQSCTDWQAAFGFSSSLTTELHDDDLGFDPWNESSKALADLIEKESLHMNHAAQPMMQHRQTQAGLNHFNEAPPNLPPGFPPNHVGSSHPMGMSGSKMLGLMQFPPMAPSFPATGYHDVLSDASLTGKQMPGLTNTQSGDPAQMKDWQDGLRALLPNINISFGAGQQQQQQQQLQQQQQQQQQRLQHPAQHNHIHCQNSNALAEEPHWMASLQQLTDETTSLPHRMPFVPQSLGGAPWPAHNPTALPPPGFAPPPVTPTEPHKLAEGLQ